MTRSRKKTSSSVELAREIHHRVKNNLQIIASILRLQMRQEDSPAAQKALSGAVHRIMGMVQVHDLLSAGSAKTVDLKDLLDRLLDLNIQTFLMPGQTVQGAVRGKKTLVDADTAASVAIVVNELIVNTLKHAFAGRREGRIEIDVAPRESELSVTVSDNGVGLPADFNLTGSSGLGLRLVRSVAENDLRGTFEMTSERGTRAVLKISARS